MKSNNYEYRSSLSRSSSPAGSLDRSSKRSKREIQDNIDFLKRNLVKYVVEASNLDHKYKSIYGSRNKIPPQERTEYTLNLNKIQNECKEMEIGVVDTVREIQSLAFEKKRLYG